MVDLKTNPNEFLDEFPQFVKYLKETTHKKIQISEPKVINKPHHTIWIEAEARYGNVKKPLGVLTLIYDEGKEEIERKTYDGRLPKVEVEEDVTPWLGYSLHSPHMIVSRFAAGEDSFDRRSGWGRDDNWSVPFP